AILKSRGRRGEAPAGEVEGAGATRPANDPPGLVDREPHGADVTKAGGGQADECKKRNQRGANSRCNLHEATLLVRVKQSESQGGLLATDCGSKMITVL